MKTNNYTAVKMGIGLFALMTLMIPYSAAFSWVLYGNVINATNCAPLVSANVSSPYNGHAFNITNKIGNYSLPLGIGSWNVTVKATGYRGGSYSTPYESSGAVKHNFALVPTGGSPGTCLSSISNETVVNATTTAVTTTPPPHTTSVPTVVTTVASTTTSSSFPTTEAVAVIIIVVVIIVIAYALTRKPQKPQHHAEHKAE